MNMADFAGVVPALGRALSKRGFDALTPVQEAVLAPELTAADLLVSAQTGSGKTVAFGLALAPALLGGEDGRPLLSGPGAPTMADLSRGRFVAVEVLGDDLRLDLVLEDR
jgi:ATP-dependent RNA helicase DeaD